MLIVGSFVLIAMTAELGPWVHGPGSYLTSCPGNCQADPLQAGWSFGYTAYSLLHFNNPFLTNVLNYPMGLNMMENAFIPLLGLAASPVSFLWGPAASVNVMVVASIAGSATAAFFAFRRWAPWTPAAYAGGLLYGCSPYVVSQGVAHINLAMVPFPPLALILLDDILIRHRWSIRRSGIALGALISAQLLTSTEVLASSVVMTLVGVALLVVFRWGEVSERLRRAGRALSVALTTFLVISAYPLWVLLFGPYHFSGPVQSRAELNPLSNDLVSLVIPSDMQRISPGGLQHLSNTIAPLGLWMSENGGYIGLPLLIVLVLVAVKYRHIGIVRFATAMGLVALLFSFGPTLLVDGHSTGIPLPFRILTVFPFLNSLVASRFSLYVGLFAALLLAVGIDRLRSSGYGRIRPGRPAALAALLIAMAALVPLIPAWPYASSPTAVPTFFATSAVDAIPTNSVLLTYPYPSWPFAQPMYWQSLDGLRFKMPGGDLISPASLEAENNQAGESTTQLYLENCESGESVQPTSTSVEQVTNNLINWDVGTVVVTESAEDPQCALQLFEAVLGRSPRLESGVWVWFGVQSDLVQS